LARVSARPASTLKLYNIEVSNINIHAVLALLLLGMTELSNWMYPTNCSMTLNKVFNVLFNISKFNIKINTHFYNPG